MATGTGERFDIGRVAALTFGVIGRNPILFIGVALLFSGLPAFALTYSEFQSAFVPAGFLAGWFVPFIVVTLITVILGALMQTSLVVATLQDLSGQRVDIAACLKRALVMFFPLIGLSILMALGTAAAAMLLIIPGLILYVMWFVAVPALVEERRGVIAALGRSRQLTQGARWPIFGLVVAFLLLSALLSLAPALLGFLALGSLGGSVVQALLSVLTSLISSTGIAATYVELRTVKEGTNVDALAAIFA